MDIICIRCANTDCECVPYDEDCDENFKEKIETNELVGEDNAKEKE